MYTNVTSLTFITVDINKYIIQSVNKAQEN